MIIICATFPLTLALIGIVTLVLDAATTQMENNESLNSAFSALLKEVSKNTCWISCSAFKLHISIPYQNSSNPLPLSPSPLLPL
jgi:hypothetical protein